MGISGACDECGKKFKVFAKRKKCLHCMGVTCKSCYSAHVQTKHPTARHHHYHPHQRRRFSMGGAHSVNEDDGDLHFLSPINAHMRHNGELEYDESSTSREGMGVDGGSDDDDDDDDEDEALLDGEGDDLLLGTFNRQSTIEEEENQYQEFLQIQEAVITWAKKEMEVKKQERIAKRNYVYAISPVPDVGTTAEYQERELFAMSYAIWVTLAVWAIYGMLCIVYMFIQRTISRSTVTYML